MAEKINRVEIPYKPRLLQYRLHNERKRFTVLVIHRRFGKTVWSVNELIKTALTCPRLNPQVAYIAPTYAQAKRVAWNFTKQYTEPLQKAGLAKYWDTELRCEITREKDKATIFLLGAENPDSLRGMYLDGVVMDEYAQMPASIYSEIIRPLLSDRQGWCVWIGTPKGHNHLYNIYTDTKAAQDAGKEWYYAALMKYSETSILDPSIIPVEEVADSRETMTEAHYNQEFECDFMAALEGAFYGEKIAQAEREGRICSVPYDTHGQVYTGWDLGYDNYTAIWFAQPAGGEWHLIDYYENSHESLDHYVKVVKDKGYNYAEHLFPHDVKVHEMQTGRSRFEALQSMGLNPTTVPKLRPEDGINAVESLLSRCWFDAKKTFRGIECLRQYSRKKDRATDRFQNKALHDEFSDGADAFRTLCTGLPGFDPTPYITKQRYENEPRRAGTWMSA